MKNSTSRQSGRRPQKRSNPLIRGEMWSVHIHSDWQAQGKDRTLARGFSPFKVLVLISGAPSLRLCRKLEQAGGLARLECDGTHSKRLPHSASRVEQSWLAFLAAAL